MKSAYIIDGIRTPFGNFRGGLSDVRTDDLAAHVLKELVSRNPHLPLDKMDDVIMGCANQAGEDNRNVARMALLLAGRQFGLGIAYYVALTLAAALFVHQQRLTRHRSVEGCFRAFLNNHWVGLAVFAGIAADYAL